MTSLSPYLLFDGKCQQAMEFYHSCLGGDLSVTKVKDTPAREKMAESQHDKVLNARLKSPGLEISASDWLRPDRTATRGNTVCLYLSAETYDDLKTAFDKLSVGAEITDPLSKQFFGSYGALNDQFGVRWMFHSAA